MSQHPAGAGKSSYDLIDRPRFWSAVSIKPGMTVLDLACGPGYYTTEIAQRVGAEGRVIAVDLWEEGISRVRSTRADGACVETHVADVSQDLPVENQSVDLCLMATILHDLAHDGTARATLGQVARVLKPDGILSVIEFKKQDGPPGPPREIRLRLEEVTMLLLPVGLMRFSPVVDLGPDLWFAEFRRLRKSH